MSELELLQAVRLKGRATGADLVETSGIPAEVATAELERLGDAGLIKYGKLIRITPEGRERLSALLATERDGANTTKVAAAYDDFRSVNGDFKALVSEWQIRDGEPNPHDDGAYDSAVIARLQVIDDRVQPIVGIVAQEIPRLRRYATKLTASLEKVNAGDTAWFTRPLADSYHTVWFELHEELILACGLTRDDEAKAGHAQ
ncbi:MarR family transcriptional regulator [Williamsia sp. R60]